MYSYKICFVVIKFECDYYKEILRHMKSYFNEKELDKINYLNALHIK